MRAERSIPRGWLVAACLAWACIEPGGGESPPPSDDPVSLAGVKLNEVSCRGTDWVELTNIGEKAVSLGGLSLTDDPAAPKKRQALPAGAVLAPGGFLAVEMKAFGISCGNDEVRLLAPDGAVLDAVSPPAAAAWLNTWGRYPDGDGEWRLTLPTRAGANQPAPALRVRLNEVACKGTDWVEIVSLENEPVDLAGYALTDDPEIASRFEVLPAGSVIAPKGWFSVQPERFGIACGSETVWLLDLERKVVDSIEVPVLSEANTVGRFPDGTGPWLITLPTRDEANQAALPEKLTINEVSCHDSGWVEIANIGEKPANLQGWVLASGTSEHVLSAAVVEPGRMHVVPHAKSDPAGFGFALKCGRSTVLLKDPTGVERDRVAIPYLIRSATSGRVPDGAGPFLETVPTLGLANRARVDPQAEIFDPFRVGTIDLLVSPDQLEALSKAPYAKVPAVFTFTPDGATDASAALEVGVRLKGGGGSFRPLTGKPGFKIDINWQHRGQRFSGLKMLTLNNMVQDHSQLAQWLAYRIFHSQGVPAPRVGYVWLRLNGEDYGLYLHVETPDDLMMDRYFATTQHLYEGAYWTDVFPGRVFDFEVDVGNPDERSDLMNLARAATTAPAGEFEKTLEPYVDWDEMLAMFAAEIFVNHWDGYAYTQNNYFLHSEEDGRFSMLPWGTDQTFCASSLCNPEVYTGDGILIERCVREPGCRARYEEALMHLLETVNPPQLVYEIRRLAAHLAPYVALDMRKEQTNSKVSSVVEAVVRYIEYRSGHIAERMACMQTAVDELGDGLVCELKRR